MRANAVVGWIMLVVVIGAGVIASQTDDRMTRLVCTAVALLMLGWYAVKGHLIDGWIGSSYREMAREISEVEKVIGSWEYPDGRIVPEAERGEILARHQRLIEKIRFHPEAPER